MTNRQLPWDEIALPDRDYNVRLVGTDLTIPVHWGKDMQGHLLLIVDLAGDHSVEFNREPIVIRGIGVDLRSGDRPGFQRLVLSLLQREDSDLFFSLCRTLIEALALVTEPPVALFVTLQHLKRWKAFLAGRRGGLLSPEQVRGLFAELLVLRDLYSSGMTHRRAVGAWTGADRIKQDFVTADVAIEVKSLSGLERNAVRISSEDQLEFPMGSLFLLVMRLLDAPADPSALSLNALVSDIEASVTDAEAVEEFQRKLSAAGYAPVVDHNEPLFVAGGVRTYLVEDGFPRVVRSGLAAGIARVTYDLALEAMEPFRCTRETLLARINGPVA